MIRASDLAPSARAGLVGRPVIVDGPDGSRRGQVIEWLEARGDAVGDYYVVRVEIEQQNIPGTALTATISRDLMCEPGTLVLLGGIWPTAADA